MDSVAVAKTNKPEFAGTPEQQELAGRAFELFRRQGVMYAADAPITIALDKLAAGLSRYYPGAGDLPARVDAALQSSPEVFRRQEEDGKVSFVATKSGRFGDQRADERHMFRQRLNAEATEVSAQESRAMTESWLAQAQARAEGFNIFQEPAAEAAIGYRGDVIPSVAPASPYVLPSRPAPRVPADRYEAPATDLRPAAGPSVHPIDASPLPAGAELEGVAITPAIEVPTAPVEIEPEPTVAAPPYQEETAAPVAEAQPVPVEAAPPAPEPVRVEAAIAPPVPEPAPVAPAAPARRSAIYAITTPEGRATFDIARPVNDIIGEHGAALQEMMAQALRDDFRFASFGEEWFPEEGIERFSKGDFRRIKEYLVETGEALSDRAFMSDVLNRRETDPDYERLRFSLNYRMLREKKDFEFVGIGDVRLWVVSGQSPVAAPKRKPSELGQDYRYLEDPAIRALEPALPEGQARLEYALSYYAYENGLLPYDNRARAILPGPVLDEQRAALLRIEVPVLFTSFPVELRYPTGNRGGYMVGFDAFFQENLVPGARFTLEPTDQANVLVLRFERTGAQEANMLQIDERRGRYVFRPVTYYAETDPAWMLTEERYPKLDGMKQLSDAERKKSESVVAQAFEIAGEPDNGRFYALLDDLLPIINVERPFSPGAVRALIEGQPQVFEADPSTPGAYYYDPSKR